MNNYRYILFAVAACFLCFSAAAQTDLEDQTIVITKDKKIEFAEMNRNFEKILYTPKDEKQPEQVYSYEDGHLLPLVEYNPRMRVVGIRQDTTLSKLYGNYVKAGLGNYGTTYLEAWTNNKRADKLQYGAHFKHLASANGPVKNSGNSVNRLDGYGKYFLSPNSTFKAQLAYQRNRYNFYGYDHDLVKEVSKNDVKQLFNSFEMKATYEGDRADSALKYIADVNFGYIKDNFKAKENEIGILLGGNYKLDPTSNIDVKLGGNFINRADTSSASRALISVRPTYIYSVNRLKAFIGFNYTYSSDTLSKSKGSHLYPVLGADYTLVPNKVIAYAKLDGGMEKNTFRSFVNEMPFLDKNQAIQNSNKKLDFTIGVRGNLKNSLFYVVKGGYKSYQNMAFFVNDAVDSSRFDVVYDHGGTSVTNLGAELGYYYLEKFKVSLKGDYFGYATSDIKQAWHKPSFVGNLNGTYTFREKILFSLDFYLMGGIKAKSPTKEEVIDLKTIADCSLKTEYRFSERFGAFVELNNIFAQKYQKYLYYKNKGFNILIGLNATF
jgi:hypothetical protein